MKIHVIHNPKDSINISNQYILFSKVFDQQRKKYGYTQKAIEETIKNCKNEHILKKYIQSKESEVTEIMAYFLDQEEATRLTIKEQREEGRKEEQRNSVKNLALFCLNKNVSFEDCLNDVSSVYPEMEVDTMTMIIKEVYSK